MPLEYLVYTQLVFVTVGVVNHMACIYPEHQEKSKGSKNNFNKWILRHLKKKKKVFTL